MSDSKYKIFRNFMVNELGISRDDIKEWTMQAVTETVEKGLHGIDIEKIANIIAHRKLESVYDYDCQKRLVSEAIGNIVRERLSISIGLKGAV